MTASSNLPRVSSIFPAMTSDLDVFITNVLRVLEARGWNKIDLGRKAAAVSNYSPRSITAALNREQKSSAFSLYEGIAKALNVPMFMLLIPDVRLDLIDSREVRSLFTKINQLQQPAIDYISSVAEREASYVSQKGDGDSGGKSS